MRELAALIPLVALAAYGCEVPTRASELPPPSFIVSPATVAPGDTFTVAFTLQNPTDRAVNITSGAGCLFFLRTFRDSDAISVEGLTYFCTASIRTFTIPPHDSLHVVRHAVAAERLDAGVTAPLPPGIYRIQTMMNAALPELEAPLTVAGPDGAT